MPETKQVVWVQLPVARSILDADKEKATQALGELVYDAVREEVQRNG